MKARITLPKHVGGFVRRLGQFSPHRRSHQHAELEFNLVVQGCGTYIVEARRYELTPRSLLWLFPRQEHVLIDFTADFVMWVVVFRTSLVRNLCLSDSTRVLRRMNPPGDFCRTLSAAFAEKLIRLLSLIAEESTPAVFNAGIGHLLLKTWETFEQSRNAEPARTLHPAVDKTVRLLRQNDPPDSVADLAREVSASPTYLSRLFLQQVGLSISEFRNRERIRRFLALADESSDETMLRLALRAGFGSYAQFHRVFRQCMNLSPAQWARNHRNAPFPNP